MNDDRMDLSPLDPMRDPGHWGAVMAATLTRVDAVLAERELASDPLALIASWTRPVLAAAAITIALLIPVELTLEMREAEAERVERLVTLSSAMNGGATPTGADFLQALAEMGQP